MKKDINPDMTEKLELFDSDLKIIFTKMLQQAIANMHDANEKVESFSKEI